jgi:hypothetical protein
MYFVWIAEQTAIISPQAIKSIGFFNSLNAVFLAR